MRILWISHFLPHPPRGGMLQRSYNLVAQLGSRAEVSLCAFFQRALHRNPEELAESVNALRQHCARIDVVPIWSDRSAAHRVALAGASLLSMDGYTVNWLKSRAMARTLGEVLADNRFDAVHFDTISLAPYRKLVPRETPSFLCHHNVESAMMHRRSQNERSLPKAAYFRQEAWKLARYERRVARSFTGHITVSSDDSARLIETVGEVPCTVIPNGVDTDFFSARTDIAQTPRSVVFAGGMSWYPNRDAMLFFANEIWPLLKARVPGVTATIIGKHPPDALRKLGERDPSFKVTGFVDDVRPYLTAAAVYICPIRDGGGTRLKLLDAMSMGKAIVSTTVAAEGLETVPDKHLLLADTPTAFADSVVRLFDDADLRASLERAARAHAERHYDWRLIGQNLFETYRAAVER